MKKAICQTIQKATKILFAFGTRPEAIKLCPLVREFRKYPDWFEVKVCATAQHRAMLDQVLNVFEVIPDYDLDIMSPDQSLFDITSSVLVEMGRVIGVERPNYVFVQGDTTTTFAASLAAFYHKVKIAHVEAGLRTGNKYAPFPEEINRKLTSSLADIHFAPTETSRRNLINEGVNPESIFVTGNTVVDALLWVVDKLKCVDVKQFSELNGIDFEKKLILVTGHRRENFGGVFVGICEALKEVALRHKEVEIVYPVHLNPNVRKPVFELIGNIQNIKLTEPLGYLSFVYLMNRSFLILTDSGGIQEEAPSLGKPVLVMRDVTERPEAVEIGVARLIGTEKRRIIEEAEMLLKGSEEYHQMTRGINPYGDGRACERIVDVFINRLHDAVKS